MKHEMYAVYDTKVEAYLRPVFLPTKGAAIRAMVDCMSDPGHTFARHTEDFILYYIGDWYDDTCAFSRLDSPEPICKLIELRTEAHGLDEYPLTDEATDMEARTNGS